MTDTTKKWSLISLVWIGMIIACILLGIFLSGLAKDDEVLITKEVQSGIQSGEKIDIEIMSEGYMENKGFLMKAEINDEQVGIVYFDEEGKIRFEGDREKFEYAICKALGGLTGDMKKLIKNLEEGKR